MSMQSVMRGFWEIKGEEDPLVLPSAITNMTLEQFIKVYISIGSMKTTREKNKIIFYMYDMKLRIKTHCRRFNKFVKSYSFNLSDPSVEYIVNNIRWINCIVNNRYGIIYCRVHNSNR